MERTRPPSANTPVSDAEIEALRRLAEFATRPVSAPGLPIIKCPASGQRCASKATLHPYLADHKRA